jgi:hypothetical protein
VKSAITGISAGLGTVSAVLFIVGSTNNHAQAAFSYLFAFVYVWSIAIGALFFLMLGHSTNAAWFVPIRRPCERVVGTLPFIAALLVPMLWFGRNVYPWIHWQNLPGFEQVHVRRKLAWLSPPFFIVRAFAYSAIQVAFGELLRHWSAAQDRASSAERAEHWRTRMVSTSVAGLVVLSLTVTFASWDWVMSIEPAWYSNLYGVYVFAGGLLAALGLLGFGIVLARQLHMLPNTVSSPHYHALGRLQLAMLIFWAYIGWCHILQQWIANLPLESLWHIKRWHHGWQWEGLALVLLHFALPFFLLLFRSIKKNAWTFASVSLWLVLVHAMDAHYLILPALHQQHYVFHWLDLLALCSLSSLTVCFGSLRGARLAAIPIKDPLLARGLAYESQ